jgi:DNA-binding beta-propeller fold protein YncE
MYVLSDNIVRTIDKSPDTYVNVIPIGLSTEGIAYNPSNGKKYAIGFTGKLSVIS